MTLLSLKTLKILQWNVKGIRRFYAELLNDIETMDHMYTNDVMVFTEIWLNDGNKEGFKDIKNNPRGGISIYIRDELLPFIIDITLEYPETNMVTFSGNLFGCELNTLFIATYIPPEKSTAYHDDNCDGISNLEGFILYEVSKKDSDFLYIITGDLNARSGFIQDYILDDNIDHLSDSNWYICDDFSRASRLRGAIAPRPSK